MLAGVEAMCNFLETPARLLLPCTKLLVHPGVWGNSIDDSMGYSLFDMPTFSLTSSGLFHPFLSRSVFEWPIRGGRYKRDRFGYWTEL